MIFIHSFYPTISNENKLVLGESVHGIPVIMFLGTTKNAGLPFLTILDPPVPENIQN